MSRDITDNKVLSDEEEEEKEKCILRPMNCELFQLSMPDSSSIFMQGDTTVTVGIYGPVEGRLQKMMYDKANVEVVFSSIKGPTCVEDRTKELIIKETCEAALIVTLYPGTAICINVQEIQDCGGLLACVVNAVFLALLTSSLSMRFTIAAVSCMIEKDSDKLILDPDSTQIQVARATFTYVFEGSKKDLVSHHTTGRFTETEFIQSIDKCRQASTCVFDFYREIVKKYSKNI